MKKHFSSAVCMAALLLVAGAAADVNFSAAIAQETQVDFNTFHDQLSPYGDWVYSDRWGEVWIPTDVSDDFHPYGTQGHWANTDEYGWTWVSDYEWGDIPFHYGRWVNDPDDGWMWIPGYVWSPAWVAWRHNGQYTGWMPLPPDDAFLGHSSRGSSLGISIGGVSISFGNEGDDYGYSRYYGRDYGADRYAQNWVFVGTGHIADRDYRRYEAPRSNYNVLIRNTTNATHYTVVNNYIVNRSVDPRAVQRAGGHVETVKIVQAMKRPQFITRADEGAQAQQRARVDRPRGNGFANSAPKPTATIVQSLSAKTPPARGGHAPMHVFTRDTVAKAPLAAAPTLPPGWKEKGGKHGDQMQAPAMTPGMSGPAMSGPAAAPAEPKHGPHEHSAPPSMSGPSMSGPAMSGPAAAPAEPKHEPHEHAAPPSMSGPSMSGPAMSGPATAPAEPKQGPHEHAAPPPMSGPSMSGPAMSGPAAAPAEPKHERHEHAAPPSMSGPAMSGPPATPAEPKHAPHEHAPSMSGPAMSGPPAAPKHEDRMAPPNPAAATPAAAPKADKEPHKKHEKADDNGAPH